jgi:hypothetical protein
VYQVDVCHVVPVEEMLVGNVYQVDVYHVVPVEHVGEMAQRDIWDVY